MTTLHILITIYFCANCLCTDIEDYNKGSYKFFFLSIFFLWIIIPAALIYKFFEEFILTEVRFYYRYLFKFEKRFGKLSEKRLYEIINMGKDNLSGWSRKRYIRHSNLVEKKWLRKNT